jgi:hypothetical protein
MLLGRRQTHEAALVETMKIGRTSDYSRRIRSLNTGPASLELVNWVYGGESEERRVQNALEIYHCRGEWFFAAPILMQFVRGITCGAESVGEIPHYLEVDRHNFRAITYFCDCLAAWQKQTLGLEGDPAPLTVTRAEDAIPYVGGFQLRQVEHPQKCDLCEIIIDFGEKAYMKKKTADEKAATGNGLSWWLRHTGCHLSVKRSS